jgi:hypothetical protein
VSACHSHRRYCGPIRARPWRPSWRPLARELTDLSGCTPRDRARLSSLQRVIRRRGGRALVLAHRDELITQAVAKLRIAMPEAEVGIVKAANDDTGARIVVASVQTLARKDRLSKLGCDFTTVVVDEASSRCASPCPLATVSGIVLLKRIPTRSARPSPDRAESRNRPHHSEPLRDVCPGQRHNLASDLGRSNRSEQIMSPPL